MEQLWGLCGYRKTPSWVTTSEVLGRVHGGRDGYRREAEERLRDDHREDIWSLVKWGVVLGAEKFAEAGRRRATIARETHGRRALRQETNWGEVVEAVEAVKGEAWARFVDRYGDWGRDLALWVARRRGGMTLRELGSNAGGMDYSAVSEAIRTFDRIHLKKTKVRRARDRVCQYLNLET